MQVKKRLSYLPFFLMIILISLPVFAENYETQALANYHKGISAKTNHERVVFLEKALEQYLALYNDLRLQNKMNGMLCYNIGNCYFNLKQLGQAIYYYKTALKYLPENNSIKENLKVALSEREHAMDIERSAVIETLLFFHYNISTADRITYLIVFSTIASVCFLFLMARRRISLVYISGIAIAVCLSLSASLIFEYYSPEHTGIIVQSTNIRKDAGKAFAPITSIPLGEGSIVRVLDIRDDWYYVKISDHRKGFIFKDHLKLII